MSMEASNKTVAVPDFAETILFGAQMYYTPSLVCLGTFGNCLSVCVFFLTKMRRSSSSFYLAALAISDTGFLVSLLIAWLNMVGISIFNRPGYCQFFIYLPTLCSFLSVWFVVSFTVERFVAVRYPLRRQSMCTVARAKAIILALTCIGIILCSPVLWFSSPSPSLMNRNATICHLAEEWESWASAFNVADTVLTFVLPFTVIVVLNGLIVETVWRLARIRKTLTTGMRNGNVEKSQHGSKASASQTKITKMLLIVSSVFLCFNLPAYVMRVHAFLQGADPPRATIIAQHVCNLLFDTNFGINFVLYCASGQNFRKAVVRMIVRHPGCRKDTDPRLSLRANQFASESTRCGGSMMRQRTIVLKMPWEESCELRDLTKNGTARQSKNLSRQSSCDEH